MALQAFFIFDFENQFLNAQIAIQKKQVKFDLIIGLYFFVVVEGEWESDEVGIILEKTFIVVRFH